MGEQYNFLPCSNYFDLIIFPGVGLVFEVHIFFLELKLCVILRLSTTILLQSQAGLFIHKPICYFSIKTRGNILYLFIFGD